MNYIFDNTAPFVYLMNNKIKKCYIVEIYKKTSKMFWSSILLWTNRWYRGIKLVSRSLQLHLQSKIIKEMKWQLFTRFWFFSMLGIKELNIETSHFLLQYDKIKFTMAMQSECYLRQISYICLLILLWISFMVSRKLLVTAWPRKLSTLKLLVFAGKMRKATTVTSGCDDWGQK